MGTSFPNGVLMISDLALNSATSKRSKVCSNLSPVTMIESFLTVSYTHLTLPTKRIV